MNILLVLPKICEIKVFNITSPRYNKQIFPVPWHLIELRLHCMRLCTEACMCSDLVPLHPPPPPFHQYMYYHHHCHSLFANAYIYIKELKQTSRYRKEIVQYFVSQLIILNCSFLHHCEQRYHLLAWVDNEIENTEICMKLYVWWNRIPGRSLKLSDNSNY